jgi:cytochrome d ubiquinol oxidase subunit I
LPTFLGVSSIAAGNVALSLAGFVLFYSVLAVIDAVLLVKYVKLGPTRYAASLAATDDAGRTVAAHGE